MKIRNGFVSNSSSSSFIIYQDAISKDSWNQLIEYFSKIDELKKVSESKAWEAMTDLEKELEEFYWHIDGKYLCAEVHNLSDFNPSSLGIAKDQYFLFYR